MKITIHTTGGSHVEVLDFDKGSALDLIDDLDNNLGGSLLQFDLSDGPCWIARAHVVRVDVEFVDDE